jgi:hypothetical protein
MLCIPFFMASYMPKLYGLSRRLLLLPPVASMLFAEILACKKECVVLWYL